MPRFPAPPCRQPRAGCAHGRSLAGLGAPRLPRQELGTLRISLNNSLSGVKQLAGRVSSLTRAGEFLRLQFQHLAAGLCLVCGCKVALFLFWAFLFV